jgi:hypothetical protein
VLRRKRKGWEGEELEISHQRDEIRTGNKQDKKVSTAVNLNQFHNVKVGEGYQAAHVVRQKTGTEKVRVVDMSSSAAGGGTPANNNTHTERDTNNRLNRYLNCTGMREFRRQVEEILKWTDT